MHALATNLADVFTRNFASADREITWVAAEEERSLLIAPNTLLVGRIDARGITSDGRPFFGEWKTLSNYKGRYIAEEKLKWRTDPQALTYGVLVPETHLFTVRWAIKPYEKAKSPVVTCDFEWYTYTDAEVDHWRSQLIQMAEEIRNLRKGPIPWRTNFGSCYRFGVRYACPFVDVCNAQAWSRSLGRPRVPHLVIEQKIITNAKKSLDKPPTDLVVLDASRVSNYLDCPEQYRRKWEGEGYQEESEALTVGTDFHSAIASHIRSLMPPTS